MRQLFFVMIVSFIITGLTAVSSTAQMIKAPTKAAEPVRKKPVAKPVIKFNDDVAADTVSATRPSAFSYLLIKSNRGSAITVTINENESGKVKAGMSKKIPVSNSDNMHITLNDGQGNLYDTSFVVEDKDEGKTITVVFPEVNYNAIKNEEARIKKEGEETALRLAKEEMEALRLQRAAALTEIETSLKELVKQSMADKALLQQAIDYVKKGELPITAAVIRQEIFVKDKSLLPSYVKNYIDSGIAYNMKERKDAFLKEIKVDYEKIQADTLYKFILAVNAGKIPMSSSVQVAFKASRSSDIPFFLTKDSLENGFIAGKRPLLYALDVKSDASIFQYLFANEVSPNNYGMRFPEDKEVYATPLAYACMSGDTAVVKLFLENKATLFPQNLSRLERKKQVKFLLTKFGDNTPILSLLKKYNYDMDDGSAAIKAALGAIDSSMVFVEGGSFTMGCSNVMSSDCAADEKPTIVVTVDGFYIAKFEVTQLVWSSLMDDEKPSYFKDCPTCPVEMVSWKTVVQFITRLNNFSGKKYRLPTEAEWEYAARGGKLEDSGFVYAGGKDVNEVAWHKDNSNKLSPVGTKKPNALGLYDMSGSVAEWCSDFYAADYFAHSTLINPKGPEMSSERVVRGGSFMQSTWSSRLSNRESHDETLTYTYTGFRLALSK